MELGVRGPAEVKETEGRSPPLEGGGGRMEGWESPCGTAWRTSGSEASGEDLERLRRFIRPREDKDFWRKYEIGR